MKSFKRNIPYNDLPSLPPAVEIETKVILRKAITAGRVLSKLNGLLNNLPNPNVFIDTIHLQEAKASSEIENIITTNDELYKTIAADKTNDNEAVKEVLNYKNALHLGLNLIKKKPFITTDLCIKIVQSIINNDADIRVVPGTTLKNSLGETVYTPPAGKKTIQDKLSDLEKFIHGNDELDPLIKMALMHYQFEAIHPFLDGNGRTGRILLLLYLKISGLLDIPAIFLSEYIIQNKSEYYRKLQNVTENQEWEAYILYMLHLVEITSQKVMDRIQKIMKAIENTSMEIKMKIPSIYSGELIQLIYRMPYTKRQHLVDANIGNAKTAGRYLKLLEEHGFMTTVKVGKEKLYINEKLLKILKTS